MEKMLPIASYENTILRHVQLCYTNSIKVRPTWKKNPNKMRVNPLWDFMLWLNFRNRREDNKQNINNTNNGIIILLCIYI